FSDGPYVHNGRVYIDFSNYTPGDWIYALDSRSGSVVKQYSLPATTLRFGELTFLGDLIYCPSLDGNLYTLDARTGKVVRKQPLDVDIRLTTSDTLFVSPIEQPGKKLAADLIALRANDGTILWQFRSPIADLHFGYNILNVEGILYGLA